MKIYLYDTDTGCYQGEDFADAPDIASQPYVGPGATTVAPPPYRHGEVPVFHAVLQTWEIATLAALRMRTGEKP